jgi:hypothetical protein
VAKGQGHIRHGQSHSDVRGSGSHWQTALRPSLLRASAGGGLLLLLCCVVALAANASGSPILASSARSAAKLRLPRITSAPASLKAGSPALVAAVVPNGKACRLVLSLKSGLGVASRRAKAVEGILQFAWTVPKRVRPGAWKAQVSCAGIKRVSRRTIHARGSHAGRAKLASSIRAIVLRHDLLPPQQGYGAAGYLPWRAVVVQASDWFGGHGVDVYSNGCGDCFPVKPNDPWGNPEFQCTDLANRFVHDENFGPTIGGNANELAHSASGMPGYYTVHGNGSGYIPVPGDLITFGSGAYGHVVVVSGVSSTEVDYVEQNASPTGTGFLLLHGSTLSEYENYMPVIGIIHAKANTSAPNGPGIGAGSAYVEGFDNALWLYTAPFSTSNRVAVEGGVRAFSGVGSQHVYVLGFDNQLWLYSSPFGSSNRIHVEGGVEAVDGVDTQHVYVEGTDNRLWLYTAPFSTSNRVAVEGGVKAFSGVDSQHVYVLGFDNALWLYSSPFSTSNRIRVEGGVEAVDWR